MKAFEEAERIKREKREQ